MTQEQKNNIEIKYTDVTSYKKLHDEIVTLIEEFHETQKQTFPAEIVGMLEFIKLDYVERIRIIQAGEKRG